MPQRQVPMPPPESKSYMCSCGYGPGNTFGVATHKSKAKARGEPEENHQSLILVDLPEPEPEPAWPPAAAPAPPEPDVVVVDGRRESGKIVEPKQPTAPTAFSQQVSTTAELRAYYDYMRAHMQYDTGDFGRWMEELARLALEELFGLELKMLVRQKELGLSA